MHRADDALLFAVLLHGFNRLPSDAHDPSCRLWTYNSLLMNCALAAKEASSFPSDAHEERARCHVGFEVSPLMLMMLALLPHAFESLPSDAHDAPCCCSVALASSLLMLMMRAIAIPCVWKSPSSCS